MFFHYSALKKNLKKQKIGSWVKCKKKIAGKTILWYDRGLNYIKKKQKTKHTHHGVIFTVKPFVLINRF